MSNRKVACLVHDEKYSIFRHKDEGIEYRPCFYCGEPAWTMDHVPPISRVDDYRSLGLKREVYVKVASCRECNTLLGDSLQESLIERVEYCKDKLVRKYRKLLNAPEWDNDELDELGGRLKQSVTNATVKQRLVRLRLEYYNAIDAYIAHLDAV